MSKMLLSIADKTSIEQTSIFGLANRHAFCRGAQRTNKNVRIEKVILLKKQERKAINKSITKIPSDASYSQYLNIYNLHFLISIEKLVL